MSENAEQGDFSVRVDFERILETIAARIYDNQYAFLRENVQNAIDAVRIQAQRDKTGADDPCYRIEITVAGNECSITDNGIGMNRKELMNNFWTMGASGKNTDEARAAGCIGTFGIGGFANFGVCETLEVTSRSSGDNTAQKTSLSRSAFSIDRSRLPTVSCEESNTLAGRGTIVRGISKQAFDIPGLLNYVREFVRHVKEGIYFNGNKISQEAFSGSSARKHTLGECETRDGVTFQLFVDGDSNLSADIFRATIGNRDVECVGYVRLIHGSLDAYKRGFRLCATNVASRIGVSGWIDCDELRPTAGRDTLDGPTIAVLTKLFHGIEVSACDRILEDTNLLAGHIRLIPEFLRQGLLEKLGNLTVELVGGKSITLGDIRKSSAPERRVFYTSSGQTTPATEVLAARGHLIVKLSGNRERRPAECEYLNAFCGGQELDGLIECLEIYRDVDAFERSVLSELEFAIRKLFKPPEFRLIAGKLTLDTPIYWSGKVESGAIVAFVDTRHGEFQKLKPLGYSTFFWSMIETFCREYLGETLKRQSLKFFGSGAIDLDAFSKANSELWELVLGDIEVSRVGVAEPGVRVGAGQVEVVGSGDIAQVTISSTGGVTEAPATGTDKKKAAKLLHIVDETGSTGLGGYYLRIPESATAAFGDIIRTFPSFAVVWFANRVTWQGSDLNATAFLLDITLDRFLASEMSGEPPHGSMELNRLQIQTYAEQLYFLIPPILQNRIVPQDAIDLVKIQIRHELVDLNRSRAWTSKETKP